MSSIIKSERIRNQSVINLSERFKAFQIEYDKMEEEDLAFENHIHNSLEASALYEPASSKDSVEEVLAASHQKKEEILSEAHEAAQRIVEEAKQRAEEILSAALTKAEAIKEETREEQTHLLYETQVKSERMLQEVNEEVETLKRQAEEEKQALIMSSEGDLINILQKLLGHIISEEVFENTSWLKCLVRKMIQGCHTKDEIKVCVSQSIFEQLTQEQKKEIEALGEKVTLEARNTLNETTCVVETKLGNISYDVMEGLERVISEIKTLEKLS